MATVTTAEPRADGPAISLIMTVRDGARYLAQALDSVRAQTFGDWELVLWDDGSSDDTPAIARAAAASDPRVRVFHAAAAGRRSALVEAHRQARGMYLGWIDADDWLAPEALARTHAAITSRRCDMVYTDRVEVDAEGKQREHAAHPRIPYTAHGLLLDFMTFHFRLFSRDVFDRAGGIAPQHEIAIDYDLCLRIAEHGRIEHVSQALYFYRVHAPQMSSRRRTAQIEASAAAIRAALVRRGMTSFELVVDVQRGRFELVHRPPRVGVLQLALASAFPSLRRAEPIATPSVIGYWPSLGRHTYPGRDVDLDRGARLVPLGHDLASLVRAVWTGRAGDLLRIVSLAPLFEAVEDGRVLGACLLFLKTIDHALARRMRVVWVSSGPHAASPQHAAREVWLRSELAARCHDVVEVAAKPRPIASVIDRRRVPGALPISIVIPLRNRAGADVRNALASLAWQRGGRPREIILVSHGSSPQIEGELRTLAAEAGATLVTVGSPADAWNKPLALNTGLLATDPETAFVMTMDGDMILADNMLETVLDELRADPQRLVLCQSSDLPQDCALPGDPAVIHTQFAALRQRATVRGRYGTGGIQAMRRSFLIEIRGYDEDMVWWGALDTDLVRRAQTAGLRPSWVTDRTAMLHQWHPRKHSILDEASLADAAQGSWQRNHQLMEERAGRVARNPQSWGATIAGE